MKNISNKKRIFLFFIIMILVFTSLYIGTFFYETDVIKDNITPEITKLNITDLNDTYSIDVDYPRFKSDSVNSIIMDYIFSYIKNFKNENNNNKSLNIDYSIYFIDKYINIMFYIDNSLNNIKHSNIIINTKTNKEAKIENVYDKEYLVSEINRLVNIKYSTDIYNKISNNKSINDYTYIVSDKKITVYFYNIEFDKINYTPYVDIYFKETEEVSSINNYDKTLKSIAFTFDDGPSEYTLDILKTLESYNSSATFFMIGSKLSTNKDIVLKVDNSNSEVATHTYSHKYLTKLNKDEIEKEINSATILFNNITNNTIKYLRPPYGSYNKKVLESVQYPIVLWNIDTKDWLHKDATLIYNNIITNACDGCIVLMHDLYPSTLEAVKKVVPELKNMGYQIVSISHLSEIKGINLIKGNVYKQVK